MDEGCRWWFFSSLIKFNFQPEIMPTSWKILGWICWVHQICVRVFWVVEHDLLCSAAVGDGDEETSFVCASVRVPAMRKTQHLICYVVWYKKTLWKFVLCDGRTIHLEGSLQTSIDTRVWTNQLISLKALSDQCLLYFTFLQIYWVKKEKLFSFLGCVLQVFH